MRKWTFIITIRYDYLSVFTLNVTDLAISFILKPLNSLLALTGAVVLLMRADRLYHSHRSNPLLPRQTQHE